MAKIETVKVKADTECGFMIINKSDLTEKDSLFVGKKATEEKKQKNTSKK